MGPTWVVDIATAVTISDRHVLTIQRGELKDRRTGLAVIGRKSARLLRKVEEYIGFDLRAGVGTRRINVIALCFSGIDGSSAISISYNQVPNIGGIGKFSGDHGHLSNCFEFS